MYIFAKKFYRPTIIFVTGINSPAKSYTPLEKTNFGFSA